jgi:hypothetical protein
MLLFCQLPPEGIMKQPWLSFKFLQS